MSFQAVYVLIKEWNLALSGKENLSPTSKKRKNVGELNASVHLASIPPHIALYILSNFPEVLPLSMTTDQVDSTLKFLGNVVLKCRESHVEALALTMLLRYVEQREDILKRFHKLKKSTFPWYNVEIAEKIKNLQKEDCSNTLQANWLRELNRLQVLIDTRDSRDFEKDVEEIMKSDWVSRAKLDIDWTFMNKALHDWFEGEKRFGRDAPLAMDRHVASEVSNKNNIPDMYLRQYTYPTLNSIFASTSDSQAEESMAFQTPSSQIVSKDYMKDFSKAKEEVEKKEYEDNEALHPYYIKASLKNDKKRAPNSNDNERKVLGRVGSQGNMNVIVSGRSSNRPRNIVQRIQPINTEHLQMEGSTDIAGHTFMQLNQERSHPISNSTLDKKENGTSESVKRITQHIPKDTAEDAEHSDSSSIEEEKTQKKQLPMKRTRKKKLIKRTVRKKKKMFGPGIKRTRPTSSHSRNQFLQSPYYTVISDSLVIWPGKNSGIQHDVLGEYSQDEGVLLSNNKVVLFDMTVYSKVHPNQSLKSMLNDESNSYELFVLLRTIEMPSPCEVVLIPAPLSECNKYHAFPQIWTPHDIAYEVHHVANPLNVSKQGMEKKQVSYLETIWERMKFEEVIQIPFHLKNRSMRIQIRVGTEEKTIINSTCAITNLAIHESRSIGTK